jgi:hypothetical protein
MLASAETDIDRSHSARQLTRISSSSHAPYGRDAIDMRTSLPSRDLLSRHRIPGPLNNPPHASADVIPATHKQGSMHGFLLLKSADGKVIAIGDQVNIVRGD